MRDAVCGRSLIGIYDLHSTNLLVSRRDLDVCLTNHVSFSLLELAAVHAASRLSGLQLHLVQAAWQAVLLHSSQHSELLGIDSLIMKCGICGSQIMVLILARDTTHWAVRVLSSSSVPAHLPINWLEGA